MIDDDYRSMIQNLNEKQMIFFYNTLHHFKTSDTPLYTFQTDGAGVGKSVLLRSLYQALIKFFNNRRKPRQYQYFVMRSNWQSCTQHWR